MLPLPLELRAAAVLLALVAGVAGYEVWAHKLRSEGVAQCQAAQAKADLAERGRRDAAQQENDRESQRIAALGRAHAVDLAVASVGLRNAGAAAISRLQHPAPVAIGASAPADSGVPAIVSGEVEERLRALAGAADDARAAGLACERDRDSLTAQ